MTPPSDGSQGWSPWAPRSGTGTPPAARTPVAPPPDRSYGAPTGPVTSRPWTSPTPQTIARTQELPPRPPLREPGELGTGFGPRPPTTWTQPQPLTPVADPTPGHGRRTGGRSRALTAALGALIGALAIGLVFAGYVIGHRSDTSAVTGPSRIRTTGGALDIQQILKMIQPSVVSILTGHTTSFYDSAGSGVVISKDGLILTNNHVIDGAQQITVKFSDGSQATAKVVGASPADDVALIKSEQSGTVAARLGSSDALRVGDDVVAIGNALNLGGAPSVTRGIVSGKERSLSTPTESLDHLIQTDAAINHGNSGGPLINARGEVVGINTAIREDAQSIGFAIAIDKIKALIPDLKKGKGAISANRAFLGVQTIDVDSPDLSKAVKDQFGVTADHGAFIVQVTAKSAAEDAGLLEGDVIVEIDGNDISTNQEVGDVITSHKPGDRITITVERDGHRRSFDVTLRKR